MLLLVYRSIATTLIQLFMTFVSLLCARGVVAVLAYNNAFGLTTFAANILTMLAIAAGHGLRDLPGRPISRGAAVRRGSRNGVLHDVSWRGPGGAGVGPDHRRCDVLPELRAAALVQHDGRAGGDRHAGRRAGRGHAGSRRRLSGQQVRPFRVQGGGQAGPAVGAGRHRGGALARTDSGRECRRRPRRHGHPAELQDELQRPLLPAHQRPVEPGASGRRPAFLAGPDEPRHADGRGRPRHAQSRPTCWCWTRWPRTSFAWSASP